MYLTTTAAAAVVWGRVLLLVVEGRGRQRASQFVRQHLYPVVGVVVFQELFSQRLSLPVDFAASRARPARHLSGRRPVDPIDLVEG